MLTAKRVCKGEWHNYVLIWLLNEYSSEWLSLSSILKISLRVRYLLRNMLPGYTLSFHNLIFRTDIPCLHFNFYATTKSWSVKLNYYY